MYSWRVDAPTFCATCAHTVLIELVSASLSETGP